MTKSPFTFTKRNIFFLLICLGGITLLILASILPLMAQKHELSEQIPTLNAKIKSQAEMAILLSVFDSKLSQLENIKGLPNVPIDSLAITESNKVIADVSDLADKLHLSNLDIFALMPESAINLQEISFSASAKGEITHLREYIFALLKVPYIGRIKQLEFETDDELLLLKLTFTVRLS